MKIIRSYIDKPNQVWSTDITYIRLEKGFVYLAAIIDWNTKKILLWKLPNTMDISLTIGVLTDALFRYPKPEILNTDQGSKYRHPSKPTRQFIFIPLSKLSLTVKDSQKLPLGYLLATMFCYQVD